MDLWGLNPIRFLWNCLPIMWMPTHNNPKMLIKTIQFCAVDMFNTSRIASSYVWENIFSDESGIERNSTTQPIKTGFKWTAFYQSSLKWNRASGFLFSQIMWSLIFCPLESTIIRLWLPTWVMTVEGKLMRVYISHTKLFFFPENPFSSF